MLIVLTHIEGIYSKELILHWWTQDKQQHLYKQEHILTANIRFQITIFDIIFEIHYFGKYAF